MLLVSWFDQGYPELTLNEIVENKLKDLKWKNMPRDINFDHQVRSAIPFRCQGGRRGWHSLQGVYAWSTMLGDHGLNGPQNIFYQPN